MSHFVLRLGCEYEARWNMMLCRFQQKHYIIYLMESPLMSSLLCSRSERQILQHNIKDSSLIKCAPRNPVYNRLTGSHTFLGAYCVCTSGYTAPCIYIFNCANMIIWSHHANFAYSCLCFLTQSKQMFIPASPALLSFSTNKYEIKNFMQNTQCSSPCGEQKYRLYSDCWLKWC